jgi:hypothetical protein
MAIVQNLDCIEGYSQSCALLLPAKSGTIAGASNFSSHLKKETPSRVRPGRAFIMCIDSLHPAALQLDDVLAIADLRHCPIMPTYPSRFTLVAMFVEMTGKMLLASSFHCCSVRMF